MRRCILLVVLAGFAASAEERPGVKTIREPDKVVVRKRTVIDFNDVTVEGELTKPEGSYVLEGGKRRFESLIRVRDDFDAELRKLADHLQQ